MLQIMPRFDNKDLKNMSKLVTPLNSDVTFAFGEFFLLLLSLGRDIKQWHSQKRFFKKTEEMNPKQTDGNNSNKTEARAIQRLKNVLAVNHKHKVSSEVLE